MRFDDTNPAKENAEFEKVCNSHLVLDLAGMEAKWLARLTLD